MVSTPLSSAPAEVDLTIVPGQRVGPIKEGASLDDLRKAFGAANVEDGELPGPEGSTMPGAWIFKGTDKELQILWDPETGEKRVSSVTVIGKAWTFSNGLKLGMGLEDVEKINGGPFQIYGFDWDYAGWSVFEGGRLEGMVGIRFEPSVTSYDPSLSGDQLLESTNEKLRAAKPVVSELIVMFPTSH